MFSEYSASSPLPASFCFFFLLFNLQRSITRVHPYDNFPKKFGAFHSKWFFPMIARPFFWKCRFYSRINLLREKRLQECNALASTLCLNLFRYCSLIFWACSIEPPALHPTKMLTSFLPPFVWNTTSHNEWFGRLEGVLGLVLQSSFLARHQ